jgi:TRAP-type C4-dicarboxylate transport system substrate-binding protein
MKRKLTATLMAGAAALALVAPIPAQALDEVTLSVVGTWSGLPLHRQFEEPFWGTALPEVSDGAITVELTTFNQLGSNGSDVFRLLSDGVFDVGMTVADYVVSDAPELEGLDVPLIAMDAATARATVEAARPWVAQSMAERFDSHLLAIAPYPPQIVFCRDEVTGLADLQGKRVRGSGRMTTQFLEALGAEGVALGFGEVPGALERGVIDCAVTGAGSGYASGWWESATHLLNIPIGGWDHVITAINLDRWNSLSPETQAFIEEQVRIGFEDPAWEDAQGALERDIACLTGGDCPIGETRGMVLVNASDEDMATAMEALTTRVLPDWAGRTGAEWIEQWNATVGATANVEIGG